VFKASFDHDLLIVDDTRLLPDKIVGGHIAPPVGPWPTAAELDTFLYARGGVPWREYPAGTMTTPGLFAGYDFDTIGTAIRQVDLTVPLGTLSHYRHVVWIVDPKSAVNSHAGNDPVSPMTALRYMTGPGRSNTLAAYVAGGGHLWLVGGGCGYASTIEWNRNTNDVPTVTFSSALGELAPGRFMYDAPRWQSAFRVSSQPVGPVLLATAPEGQGHWREPIATLPPRLDFKTPATDPLPPQRPIPSNFYTFVAGLEYLIAPNDVGERRGHGHGRGREREDDIEHFGHEGGEGGEGHHGNAPNALDSLYEASGGSLPPPQENPHNVVMTRYHGDEGGEVIFSGFDLWTWQRTQCVELVDGVLRGFWHLRRAPAAMAAATPAEPTAVNPIRH